MRASRIRVVARFTLDQLLWSPRTLAALPVVAAPVGIALVYRIGRAFGFAGDTSAFGMFSIVAAAVGMQFAAPMLSLFYASGIVTDEVEAGTMPFLLTRSVTRSELLVGKAIGSVALSALLFTPSMIVAYYLILGPGGMGELGARFTSLLADLAAAVLGLAAYNGLFALLGTALKRPLLTGLFFVFGWQVAASIAPGSARLLTITHYLYALMPHETLTSGLGQLFGERPSVPVALLALAVIILATHGLAALRFQTKEV